MTTWHQLIYTKKFKKMVMIAFLAASLVIWMGIRVYGYFYISTDDAYVNADVIQIAPRVSGRVVQLPITNNQYVKKDELLFQIDPEPFEAAVNAQKAQFDLANAELDNAILSQKRISALVTKKVLSQQEGDNAIAQYKTTMAKLEKAKADLALANLNLSYTNLKAPASGWVTNVTLRIGTIVPANQPQFALISDEEFWVDANFKETELEHIKSGQTVTITTDMYPNHPFNGVVDSISGGAGTAFSLLPPQNATGNWVKVTQRVPVRIRVLNPDRAYPLRIGTTATVTIHLHQYLKNDASTA